MQLDLRKVNSDGDELDVIALSCLFVDSKYRFQGVGRAFLRFAEATASGENVSAVVGWTEDENVNFYKHSGWTVRRVGDNRHLVFKTMPTHIFGEHVTSVGGDW